MEQGEEGDEDMFWDEDGDEDDMFGDDDDNEEDDE